jgi:hypothetical protein
LTFCRGQPPDYVLKEAKSTSKFFKCIGSVHNIENSDVSTNGRSAYQALTEEEYEAVSVHIKVFWVAACDCSYNSSFHNFVALFSFLV